MEGNLVNKEYQVQLPNFEGPLDLLLYLIKKNEIDIYDIPIAFILEEYMKYVDVMKVLNLNSIGEFLVMAAHLLYIKSRMLLPTAKDDGEEIEDPRTDLVQRLLEYEQFKLAAQELANRSAYYSEQYDRQNPSGEIEKEEKVLVNVSVFDLIKAFEGILKRTKDSAVKEILVSKITINDKISQIIEILEKKDSITLNSLFQEMKEKIEMIVTFLALLELIRLKLVRVEQETQFGDITIFAN
ncbi:MAG: chromosome segregation protein ScpA [Candidatus Schekmanbacteria bacterium]|nr:MAG: chromosome segregation protein ScpA [Candidatus Schekmanbacteria bacterium]